MKELEYSFCYVRKLFFHRSIYSAPYEYISARKSYYRDAKFAEVGLYIEAENIIAETKYFTDEGTITIPGGGYTVISDDETNEVLSKAVLDTIASGRDMTFGLRMNTGRTSRSYIGKTWAEYCVTDDSGSDIAFAGGAETGLNGRNI